MKYNDSEIIDIIKMLKEGKGDEEQIKKWSDNQLIGLDEVYDLIFYSQNELSPEEILKRARELSKPICL